MGTTRFPNGLTADLIGDVTGNVTGYLIDDQAEAKTSNYTVIVNADSGKTFTSTLDAIVYTLPSIAVGNTITIVNMAADGAAKLSISPAALDGISYVGSATDDKDLINTKTTANQGDFVTLASLDGVVAWQVVAVRGVWAKQA